MTTRSHWEELGLHRNTLNDFAFFIRKCFIKNHYKMWKVFCKSGVMFEKTILVVDANRLSREPQGIPGKGSRSHAH